MKKITILKIMLEPINDSTFGIIECKGGYYVPIISMNITPTFISYKIHKLNQEIKIYYEL